MNYSWGLSIWREIISGIDKGVYSLISYMYQIFFNIANATLISGDIIKMFFSRVQLILGIVVLFRLAISLISGIVNPDSMTDNKSGISKIVTRVLTSLVMLVLIIPLNIPSDSIEAGSYEAQLNNHGILFGTLYDFQSRILSQNTMAKLILGQNLSVSNQSTATDIAEAGKQLSGTIIKAFVRPNLAGEEGITTEVDPMVSSNRLCQDDESGDDVEGYLVSNDSNAILSMVTLTCSKGDSFSGKKSYIFEYNVILSTACGVLVLVIMIGFTLDMAIRAFKLAFLRLIAPVPIISYMSPKSENNGTFGSWVKAVTSTYLDLFLRVAILYFIIFMIDAFQKTGIIMDVSTGAVGKWSWIFIIIGLFFFAKEAPKFITESLGIKSNGGFFKNVGRMLGIGAASLGIIGAAATNFRAAREEQAQLHPGDEHRARRIFGIAGSTVAGVFGGAFALAKGAFNAKDGQNVYSAAFQGVRARNTLRNAHSTLTGRIVDNASALFTGQSLSAAGDAKLKAAKDAVSKLGSLKNIIEEEAKKFGDYGELNNIHYLDSRDVEVVDENGNKKTKKEYFWNTFQGAQKFNWTNLQHVLDHSTIGKDGRFTYNNTITGEKYILNSGDFDPNKMGDLLKSQAKRYQEGGLREGVEAKDSFANNGKVQQQMHDTLYATTQAGIDFNGQFDKIGGAIGAGNRIAGSQDSDMRGVMRRANSQANGNNNNR